MVRESTEVTVEGLKADGMPVPQGDGDRVGFIEVVA